MQQKVKQGHKNTVLILKKLLFHIKAFVVSVSPWRSLSSSTAGLSLTTATQPQVVAEPFLAAVLIYY